MGVVRRGELTGQVLDERYRVIEPIGEGAMGSVYRGERLKLGRMVAIKVLNEEIPNQSSRERFEREATAMAKLEHPNCGTVLDVGVHEDRPYVVMEFVSGQNLKDVLKAGPLPIARAVEITRQVLSGLSHAHEHGIIHRDIKPANIVLSQKAGVGDFVKILDFGLVRFRAETSNLTGAMVLGTPNYMAPEQIRGGDFDHRVDLYACGVLLFELLTGSKPFQAADPVATCMLHINEPPPRLTDRASGRAFGGLEAVVARALEKDREKRFASAEEFSRVLVEAAGKLDDTTPNPVQLDATLPFAAPPPSLPPAKVTPARRSTGLAIALGAFGVVGVIVAVVLVSRSDAGPAPKAVIPAQVAVDAAPVAEPTATDHIDELVAKAIDMTAAGRRESAIDMLLDARKTYAKDARLPYHASKLYLEKMWWDDGLKQARSAIALDAGYRSDADLIKLVVKGFNTTKSYDWTLARFLREDIGAPAKPFLEDTASGHPNPIVRKRAKAELKKY
jgi:tRNA A-37 threonylcarbamoyl transferase component Bud32